MASKIKKQIQDEIFKNIKYFNPTQQALLKGLYNKIETLDNDTDIVNTIWANKDLPLRMIPDRDLSELLPGLSNLLIGEPRTGEVNLEKSFGKDWASNFENIPYNQIALVAEKNGVDPKELMYTMRDMATANRREDIAHGRWDPNDPVYKNIANEIGGVALNLFGQRQQEAIARGEDPSLKDYGLDIGQSVLEAVPYGQAIRLANNPVARNLIGGVVSNAAAPVLTEAADAIAYDDDNKRGTFNTMDAISGSLVNATGANLLRLGGLALNKVGADKVSNVLMNLGNRESRKDAAKTIQRMMDEQNAMSQMAKTFWDVEKNTFKPEFGKLPNELKAKVLAYMDNADNNAIREVILDKLHKANPVTKGQKLAYKDYQPEFLDDEIRYMMKDPQLSKYLSGDYNFYKLPSVLRLGAEESIKNLTTNKLGNYQHEQGKALTRIPLVGRALQSYIDERELEEEERKRLEDLYTKYKFDIFGGN